MSGGSDVLVDQAVQDRFSADLAGVEVPCRDARRMVLSVGDVLADSLVRAGGVVVLLVLGQDCAQVGLAEDQHPVQELMAQGSDENLSGRVRARSLDGGPQDRGAGGLED